MTRIQAGYLPADLRLGRRAILRRPGLAGLVIVTLAIGIGLSTAIFSVRYALILRRLRYAASERLVMVWLRGEGGTTGLVHPS